MANHVATALFEDDHFPRHDLNQLADLEAT